MKKKVLLCFGEKLGEQDGFHGLSDKLHAQGLEAHLFEDISDLQLKPHSVFNVINHIWPDDFEDNEYYFLSNSKDFFKLCYRIFQQTFRQFIFWDDAKGSSYDVELDEIYASLLKEPVSERENLGKDIFTNELGTDFVDDFFNSKKNSLDNLLIQDDEEGQEEIQNIYKLDGQCYLLEPMLGQVNYIELDEQEADFDFVDAVTPFDLDQKLLDQVGEVVELIANDPETVLRRQEVPHRLFSFFRAHVLTANKIEQKYYLSLTAAIGETRGVFAKVFILSFFLQVYKITKIYRRLLSVCADDQQLTAPNKYFVLVQSKDIELFDRKSEEEQLLVLETKLFRQICGEFSQIMADKLKAMEGYEPEQESVLVLVSQFLDYENRDSGYALELCKFLIEKTGNKVWLLNTCEYLTQNARVPFFDASQGVIRSEYTNNNRIDYEGVSIPFAQMLYPMPNIGGFDGIAELVESIKPALVLNISELSVTGELFSKCVSTFFLPMQSEDLPVPVGNRLILKESGLSEEIKNIYRENNVSLINLDEGITRGNLFQEEFLLKIVSLLTEK